MISRLLERINIALTNPPGIATTTGAPILPPTNNWQKVKIDLSTGILYYFDSDSSTWEVASGDTHMGNTDLTFTGSRVYDVDNHGITYNDVDNLTINTVGAAGASINLANGGTYAAVDLDLGRVDLTGNSGGGADYSTVNVTDAALILGNSAGVYYLGDGGFTPTPTASDVTPDYLVGIDSTTGRLYRHSKQVSDTAYGAGWNGVTTIAPSKNAVYDKIESVVSSIPSVSNIAKDQIGILIDGSGSAITTGFKGRFRVPYSGTITGWTILEVSETPLTGSIVVDVKLGTYANYDTTPTFSSIAGSEKPTISASEKGQDNTLTTWTTAVTAGDLIEYTVDSASTVQKVQLFIDITKS